MFGERQFVTWGEITLDKQSKIHDVILTLAVDRF